MNKYTITVWNEDEYGNKDHFRTFWTVPKNIDFNRLQDIIKYEVEIARENDDNIGYDPINLFDYICTKYTDFSYDTECPSEWQFDFDNNSDFDTDSILNG